MSARGRRAVLAVAVAVVLCAGVAGATALATVDRGSTTGTVTVDATLQNGTVGTISVDASFVGAVADEGTMTVTASGIVDGGGDPVHGEEVTVTVGGDPAATGIVQNGTLETTVEPSVLGLEPQEGAEVAIYGFESTDPATVDIVHEVVALEEGYNLHSVPQTAELVVTDVAAVSVWNPATGSYESVDDPTFELPEDLHHGLALVASGDGARLGHTFETEGPPIPGNDSLGPGWNFVGSNFDISTGAERTVQDDLFSIDASEYDIFTADFGEELDPDDTVGAYEGYWLFVEEGQETPRQTLSPIYDSADREDVLGLGESAFQFTGVVVEATETGGGGLVEVTATVQNQGDRGETQFVDLLAENDTGGFDTVDRTGLELAPGSSESVTTTYEVDETAEFNITVTTDDDERTETVTWDDAFFAVSQLSAPDQVAEKPLLLATEESRAVATEESRAVATEESRAVDVTLDALAATGDHDIFTGNDRLEGGSGNASAAPANRDDPARRAGARTRTNRAAVRARPGTQTRPSASG